MAPRSSWTSRPANRCSSERRRQSRRERPTDVVSRAIVNPSALRAPNKSPHPRIKDITVYLALKHVHLIFVALSLLTFLVRGIWLFINSKLLGNTWARVLPHVVNTILLASGIVLAVHLSMSPGSQPWLMAKIIGLIAYVGLSVAASKVSNPTTSKLLWVSALVAFVYIVSVAFSKNPLGFFG
jgi:uncharacterized membrane protein SirB2